jgi:hypothetical protein
MYRPTIDASGGNRRASLMEVGIIAAQENTEMKLVKYFASFAIVALVLSLSAFAKDTHSGKFIVSDPVQVGSTQLAPGSYKAEWSGPADNVKIDIIQKGKTVATTQGKIQTLQQPAPYDAVLTKALDNNTKQLDEIEFSHQTEALVLAGE